MATTTTTSVVQVTVFDSGGYTKTYNLDNPKPNLTLNQIKNAFKIAIDGGWLLGNNFDPVIEVRSANYSEATKTSIDGAEVVVTPSTLNYDGNTQKSVTVTGGFVTSTNLINLEYIASVSGSTFVFTAPVISDDGSVVTLNSRVSISSGNECNFKGTATLELFIGTNKISVPIVFDITIETA